MNRKKNEKKLKLVDLFAGTGAFSLAFESTGKVECVFANDMCDASKMIYDSNHKNKLICKDIHNVKTDDIPKHDILTAGFPCQPFSIAGKQKGFDDDRSNVFWKIMEIVDVHQPTAIVLENVKNLVSHDNGQTFQIISDEITRRGYHICYRILDTAKITGIPQHRERIYMVCIKEKRIFDQFDLVFEEKEKRPISEQLEEKVIDKYYYTDRLSVYPLVKDQVKKKDTIYQYRRVYVRENKSGECPTLTANMGAGGHNVPLILDDKGIRKLTPRECFSFQGFPVNYELPKKLSDSKLYKLAGNAVSFPVVKMIADRLVSFF